MYGLMVAFEPTMETLVARGRNIGLNFGNVVANSKVTGYRYYGGGGGTGRRLEFWYCGGEHLKRNCPNCAKVKYKTKKDNSGANDKCADGKTEVK